MKHLEIHMINSFKDLELATVAGLLDGIPLFVACSICSDMLLLDRSAATTGSAYIVLHEDDSMISCNMCLGLALSEIGDTLNT
jgi:hypothetical protein